MIRNGPAFRRGKHMTIKGEYAKELEQEGILQLVYTSTEDMLPDAYYQGGEFL